MRNGARAAPRQADRAVLPKSLVSGRATRLVPARKYHFGNIPLINYLPDRWRNKLAPHVRRTYTARKLRRLFDGLPVKIVHHSRIFGGYDNIIYRHPHAGRWLRDLLYLAERTPLRILGLSHLLVVEKLGETAKDS